MAGYMMNFSIQLSLPFCISQNKMCLHAFYCVSCRLSTNEIKIIKFYTSNKKFIIQKMEMYIAPEALATLSVSWLVFMILIVCRLMMHL